MKKFAILLTCALAFFACGCSDDPQGPQQPEQENIPADEPEVPTPEEPESPAENIPEGTYVDNGQVVQGPVDFNVLTQYSGGLVDATYTISGVEVYNKDDFSNGNWELFDYTAYCGWELQVPTRLVVKSGVCWSPIKTFTLVDGPLVFGMILELYNRVKEKDYQVYITRELTIDQQNKKLNIGNSTYGILHADTDSLVLAYEVSYDGGRTHNGGQHMTIGKYALSEPYTFEGTILAFNTERDAYDWLIELFRSTFGESVNLNEYTQGAIIFDNPMLSLAQLIAERDLIYPQK